MIIKAFTKLIGRTVALQRLEHTIGGPSSYITYGYIETYTPKKIYNIYIFDEPLSY